MKKYKYEISFIYDEKIEVNMECIDYWWSAEMLTVLKESISFYDKNRITNFKIKEIRDE